MAFVCKQTAVLRSASITLDHNNAVLTDLKAFFSLNTLPHTSVSLNCCISIVFFSIEYYDPYDHYAVCWVTLIMDALFCVFQSVFSSTRRARGRELSCGYLSHSTSRTQGQIQDFRKGGGVRITVKY